MLKQLLQDKVAIITGASSGIGKAIALRYAEEGAKVVVSSKTQTKCEEVTNEISENGYTSIPIVCDVRKVNEIEALFDKSINHFGKVDIVIANAGISGGNKHVAEYDFITWNKVMDTNLNGVFLTVREAFRRMKKNGGHIIVMSSQAGVEGYAGKGAYCASKFAVRGLAHALAEEGRAHDINVSTICPGTVATPILAASNTRVKNPMQPDAIADAAVYLATLRGNSLVRDVVVERLHLG
ncbi:MAG: SDR family oxidoreductase [Chlorobiales bacterium]|nr:SDR family oxidoreductase [Chlorobiales bacterium]